MFVFIDESGDAGNKFSGGSSEYFICVAVLFRDSFEVDACDRAIDQVKRHLRMPLTQEFHFARCSDRVRERFLKEIAKEDFTYYGFVLNKPRLYGRKFQDHHGFYDFVVGLICENAKDFLSDAKVVIDRCGDNRFKSKLQKSLIARMTNPDGTSLIRKVAMESSHSNNLVQLADMICGAIARSYNSDKNNRDQFRDLVQRKERRVQLWPK